MPHGQNATAASGTRSVVLQSGYCIQNAHIEFTFLTRGTATDPEKAELRRVRNLARQMHSALAGSTPKKALARIAPIGGTSHEVDKIVQPLVTSLGIISHRDELFSILPEATPPDWF